MRVHCNQGPGLAFHHLLSNALDIEVDGESQVGSSFGNHLPKLTDFLAVTVDNHIPRSVRTTQKRVVGLLNTRLAHDIAGVIEVELGTVEVLFGDLADVADHVCREAVPGIQPPLRVHGLEFRQLVAVGFDEGLLILRDVLLQRDRLVLRRASEAPKAGLDLLNRKI